MDEEEKQPEPQKKESFITRMQRKGYMVIRPPEPGELDVVEKIREMEEGNK